MTRLTILLVTLLGIHCTGDDLDATTLAIDTDGSGGVDCADLDHVLACIHDPGSSACAHADVNGDGTVDDLDAHDLHAALTATHHDCTAPDHHTSDGHHESGH